MIVMWRLDWRSYLLGVACTWIVEAIGPALRRNLRPMWLRLTYWRVDCEGCDGTGLCHGANATEPHSCCGDCGRRIVRADLVPEKFFPPPSDGTAMIGDGIMWRRPWSRRQVLKP